MGKKELKDKLLTTKLQEKEYEYLRDIADSLGLSMSAVVRVLIYAQIKKVEKTGNVADFLNVDDLN